MEYLNLVLGEIKIIKLIIKNKNPSQPLSLTDCVFALKAVNNRASFDKEDSDFDKTEIANGIVKITLDTSSAQIGKYACQLQINFPNSEIDKSDIFYINIKEGL